MLANSPIRRLRLQWNMIQIGTRLRSCSGATVGWSCEVVYSSVGCLARHSDDSLIHSLSSRAHSDAMKAGRAENSQYVQ